MLASGLQLAAPQVLRRAVDALSGPAPVPSLFRYVLVFAALAVGQAVFRFASRSAFLGRARRIEHDLRGAYFSHLIRLPVDRLEQARKGDLVSRAVHDLQDVRLFLGAGILNFLQTVIQLTVTAVFLWRIHPGLTVVSLAPFPVISVLVRRFSPVLHRRFLDADRRAGDLSALVQEAVTGMRVTRTCGRDGWQRSRFEAANGALREARARVVWVWASLFPAVGALAGLGHVAVLGLGGYWLSTGAITLGDFVAFHAYLAMLTWPMVALGWTLSLVQRGAAALGRLEEVRSWPGDADGDEPVPAPGAGPWLEADRVVFRRPGTGEPVLDRVSVAVPARGITALVGATGSGKSTLVSVLVRLLRPQGGVVRVLGVPVERAAAADLRRRLAVVPQHGFLFSDTVAANVCLGRPRDDGRIRWALEAADLADEVGRMGDGAETRVGEGGVTLSGGQRQRLALARALYGRPDVLVLDSALSNLDTRTARRVLDRVRAALPDSAVLVVSHRGSEVHDADPVWFLQDGRIADRGTHADLLARNGAYRRLYREEILRRELEELTG